MNVLISNSLIPHQNCSTEYYNIAWFKLYEAAIKNEHERAFLNYKLLIHSYENKGFHKQIQGELHILFQEIDLAIKSFKEAFIIYFNNEDYLASILMFLEIKKLNFDSTFELNKLKKIIPSIKKKYILFFSEIE